MCLVRLQDKIYNQTYRCSLYTVFPKHYSSFSSFSLFDAVILPEAEANAL